MRSGSRLSKSLYSVLMRVPETPFLRRVDRPRQGIPTDTSRVSRVDKLWLICSMTGLS